MAGVPEEEGAASSSVRLTALFQDDPQRQCVGKRGYRTKANAKRMLRRSQALHGRDRLRVYRCPHCDLWHVGHKPGKRVEPEAEPT